jgi:hypothetical protein
MEIGDRVRLRRPFKPTPSSTLYTYGIIAGLVVEDSMAASSGGIKEVVVYLYDPNQNEVYRDELGTQVMYSFYPNELQG